MKYEYHAYFSISDDEAEKKTCTVKVPALDMEFELDDDTISRSSLVQRARDEVAVLAVVSEYTGEKLPSDIEDAEEEAKSTFSSVLKINTKAYKHVKVVKVIDVA